MSDLQWAMFPFPYLAAIGPNTAPGATVYRLSTRRTSDSRGSLRFLLVEGKPSFPYTGVRRSKYWQEDWGGRYEYVCVAIKVPFCHDFNLS